MKKKSHINYLLLPLFITCSCSVSADNTNSSSNSSHWLDNSRQALDFSSRFTRDLKQHEWSRQYVAGFDFHKVFAGPGGDVGTLVLQPYLVKLSNVSKPPFFFDDGDDTELTWRIANFNYTALSYGTFNIRAGHFEIPFGLEQNIDTNGTIRQYTFVDRGVKADWGFSVNGVFPSLEYEVALTRGSSNKISNRDDPYVFSGRIGTPSTGNLITGFSWFQGKVLNAKGATKRQRIGFDMAYYHKQWEALTEVSFGENEGNGTANTLLEVSWRNPVENVHSYMQYRQKHEEITGDWKNSSSMTAGINWHLNRQSDISGEWLKELDSLTSQNTGSRLTLQIRFRI